MTHRHWTHRLRSHVGASLNAILRELTTTILARRPRNKAGIYLRNGNLEALANSLKHLLVIITADKGDGETLGTETASTTDTVQVRVGLAWHVVVDGQVDALNVNTTAEDVSGNTDALVELLEFLVAANTKSGLDPASQPLFTRIRYVPLLLAHTRVNRDGGEVALPQQLVELGGTDGALDKDDDLVELQVVK